MSADGTAGPTPPTLEETEYAVIGEYLCERTPGKCTCSGSVEFGHESHCEFEPVAYAENVRRALAPAPGPDRSELAEAIEKIDHVRDQLRNHGGSWGRVLSIALRQALDTLRSLGTGNPR